METEQGQKLEGALRAVAQMHSDTSRLLIDCDKYIGGTRRSVFGNSVTDNLSHSVPADFWMAEGVYRFYEVDPPLLFDVITVAFLGGRKSEPLLLVGRIRYAPGQLFKNWDLWSLYFAWGQEQRTGEILEYSDVGAHRITWGRLVAVPLFSIKRIEDVQELMRRVVEASPKQ